MGRDSVAWTVLALFVLICAILGAGDLVDLHTIPLALALEHQDLRLHQPNPPGYVLFVWLVQCLDVLTSRPVLALRLTSILVLAAAAYFLSRLAHLVADRTTARWSIFLFVSSPIVLFHGMTTGTYGAEALVTAVVAFLLARAVVQSKRELRSESYIIGILAGLRPTTLVFAVPMLLWSARHLKLAPRAAVQAGLAWFLGTLCWLVPQVDVAGGVPDYVSLHWVMMKSILQASTLSSGPAPFLQQLVVLCSPLVWGFGATRWLLACGTAIRRKRLHHRIDSRYVPAQATATPVPTEQSLAARTPPTPRPAAQAAPAPTSAVQPSPTSSPATHFPARPLPTILGLGASFGAAWALPPVVAALLLGVPGTGYLLAVWPGLCLWTALWLRRQAVAPSSVIRMAVGALALDLGMFFIVPTPASHRQLSPPDALEMMSLDTPLPAPRLPLNAWWDQLPPGLQRASDRALSRTDFFFDRTRDAEFEPLHAALRRLGRLNAETLIIGGRMTRAACYLYPERSVLHADVLRSAPFLSYHDRQAKIPSDPYVLPTEITWILIEGSPAQIQHIATGAPRASSLPRRPPIRLVGDFHLLPLGDEALDCWFWPEPTEHPELKLRLIREAPPEDPSLFERAENPQ